MTDELELAREILLEHRGAELEPVQVIFSDPLQAELICSDGSRHRVTGLWATLLKQAALSIGKGEKKP